MTRKLQSSPRARRLAFENLETRELLSINPVSTPLDPIETRNAAVYAAIQDAPSINFTLDDAEVSNVRLIATTKLAQPKITVFDSATRVIYLEWEPVQDAKEYEVLYRKSNEKTFARYSTGLENFTKLDGLDPNASYQVKVVAKGDGIETLDSDPSSVKTIKTKALEQLATPKFIDVTTQPRSISIAWEADPRAMNQFEVLYRKSSDKTFTVCDDVISGDCVATISKLEPDASYVVQIVAKGDGLISKDSVAAKKTIKTVALVQLPQPTITQTEIFYREANVAWQNDPRAIGYLVLWRTAKEKSWRSAHVSSGITDYYITGLEPGTSYQVKVVAIGDHFQTRNSSETKYKTIKTKAPATLEQPSIIGYAASKRELGIKWLAVQGAVGYRVEWRAANEKTWRSTHYLLQEAAHDLTDLEPNTSYVVRVIAVGDGYETLDSSAKKTKTYKTKPLDVLEQPTITETKIDPTWISIKWNSIEDANGYTVNCTRVGTKNTVSVDVDALRNGFSFNTEPGASYNVSVVAKGDGYETLDSSAKTIKLTASKFEPLAAPTILSYQTSDTAITVNWSRISGAVGYEIAYKKVGSKETVTTRVNNSQEIHNTHTISGLLPGAKYSISITALSYLHSSADSKPTTKTIATSKAPKLLAPTSLSLSLESENDYFLNWESVDNAFGYEIVMSEVGKPTETKTYHFSPASSASLCVKLNQGSIYNVKIRALGVENYLDSDFSQFTRVYAER